MLQSANAKSVQTKSLLGRSFAVFWLSNVQKMTIQTCKKCTRQLTRMMGSRPGKSGKFALLSRAIKHSDFILKFFPYRVVNNLSISSVFTELQAFLSNIQTDSKLISLSLGDFRFEYEYEIEYENDFAILLSRLHIITTYTHFLP